MRRQRLLGRGQIAVCMRSGIKCHASELVRDGRIPSLLVLPEWADPAQPQERPYVPEDMEGAPPFQPSPESLPVVEPVLTGTVNENQDEVLLEWTEAERIAGPAIQTYTLYRDGVAIFTFELDYSDPSVQPSVTTSFVDEDVEEGETYVYRVTASTSNGLDLNSNLVTIEMPAPIPRPDPVVLDGSQVSDFIALSWTESDYTYSPFGYLLYRSVDSGDYELFVSTIDLGYSDVDVEVGSTYSYYVTVDPDVGESSDPSNIVEVEFETPVDFGTALESATLNGATFTAGAEYNFTTSDFTVEAWVAVGPVPVDNDQDRVIRVASGGLVRAWAMRFVPDETDQYSIEAVLDPGNAPITFASTDSTGINLGDWYHVAMVVNRGTNFVTFYLDGTQFGDPVSIAALVGGVTTAGQTGTILGAFGASVDELRIWTVARTAQEIADSYTAPLSNPASIPNLIGYWQFNEGAGSTTTDSSVNAKVATLASGASFVAGP